MVNNLDEKLGIDFKVLEKGLTDILEKAPSENSIPRTCACFHRSARSAPENRQPPSDLFSGNSRKGLFERGA